MIGRLNDMEAEAWRRIALLPPLVRLLVIVIVVASLARARDGNKRGSIFVARCVCVYVFDDEDSRKKYLLRFVLRQHGARGKRTGFSVSRGVWGCV